MNRPRTEALFLALQRERERYDRSILRPQSPSKFVSGVFAIWSRSVFMGCLVFTDSRRRILRQVVSEPYTPLQSVTTTYATGLHALALTAHSYCSALEVQFHVVQFAHHQLDSLDVRGANILLGLRQVLSSQASVYLRETLACV